MKDKTLILLKKVTKNFDKTIDFFMAKSILILQKLRKKLVIFYGILNKNTLIFINKLKLKKNIKTLIKNISKQKDNIFKYIPKSISDVIEPIIDIFIYIIQSIIYFIKTILIIIINLIKLLIIDTLKYIKNLPHKHHRFIFLVCLIIFTSMLIIISKNPMNYVKYMMEEKPCTNEQLFEEIETAPKEDSIKKEEIVIKSGDTLAEILQLNNVEYVEIDALVKSLKECYDPRGLIPGKKITILFKNNNFFGLEIVISPEETCLVEKKEDNIFNTQMHKKELFKKVLTKKASIESSVFLAGEKAGLPHSVIVEFIKLYSWDVDFVRDIRKDDTFVVKYEELNDKDGNFVKNGNILYMNMNLSGENIALYRYNDDYFKEDGSNIKKALLRTPINGARVSSSFGYRKHPVLGYSKLHKGIDFAAPTGTPIYAAGDGKIIKRKWNGSYGNYIEIRHNSSMNTAYAHMSKFAQKLKEGSKVKQGQIIGYVGTTGRSTGPHLHYEIKVNGNHVNPATVKLPNKKALAGDELKKFKNSIIKIKMEMEKFCTPAKKPKTKDI